MKWIDDMNTLPLEGVWVLGDVPLDENDKDSGYTSEVVILDGGIWTDTSGRVVSPRAWAMIEAYKPRRNQYKYDWEERLQSFFDDVYEAMPLGFCLMGLAVGRYENGEGAIISDPKPNDPEASIWSADVLKDILGDAQYNYEKSVHEMRSEVKRVTLHARHAE